jgi:hypothetical protein
VLILGFVRSCPKNALALQAMPTYPFNSSLAQMSLVWQEINQLKTW